MKTYIKTKPGKSSLRSPSSVWQAPKHTNVWRCIYEVKGDQRAVYVEPELPSRLCPVAGMWSSNLQVMTGVKSRLFVYNLRTCSGVQVQILTLYKASLRARPDEVYYSINLKAQLEGLKGLADQEQLWCEMWTVSYSAQTMSTAKRTQASQPSFAQRAVEFIGATFWDTDDGLFIKARVTPRQLRHWAVHSHTVTTLESCVSAAPCRICRKFSRMKTLTPGSQQLLLLL